MTSADGRLGRAFHRLEPLAPEWLVAVVRPKRADPPWAQMVRFAVAIGGALLGGVLAGQAALGGLLATGALTASFGDQGGPLPQRLRRIAAGLAGAAVGLVLSRALVQEAGAAGVLVVVAAGVASAYLSAVGAVASFAGLQLLVMMAVGAGLGARVPLPALLGGFLLGAAWSTAVTVVVALVRPERGGPRVAVLAVVDRLVDHVQAIAAGQDLRATRAALAAAQGDAWDEVTAARAVSQGRRDDLHRLAALIGPLSEVARAAAAAPRGLDGAADRLRAVGAVVARHRGARADRRPVPDPGVTAALEHVERVAASAHAPGGPRPRRRSAAAGALDRLLGRRTAVFAVRLALCLAVAETLRLVLPLSHPYWLLLTVAVVLKPDLGSVFAVRLALCLAVAETLRLVLPLSHPYWLLLTVAVVLKPDLGSVFARGLQRAGGTLVGALIGIAVLAVVPPGPLLLIPVALIAFGFPLAAKRNYGMLSTFITPLVLILVGLAGGSTQGLGASRLLDTVLGAAIVLLVGYLPWPSTWRPRLGSAVADAVDAFGAYAAVVLQEDRSPAGPARRRAFAALQDVRAQLQSALAEPPPRSRYAAAWWPVLGQLEQVGDDLRSAHLVAASVDAASADDAARLSTALHDAAAAMRQRRRTGEGPLPGPGPLQAAGEDVAGLRRLLDGPLEAPRRPGRRRFRLRRRR